MGQHCRLTGSIHCERLPFRLNSVLPIVHRAARIAFPRACTDEYSEVAWPQCGTFVRISNFALGWLLCYFPRKFFSLSFFVYTPSKPFRSPSWSQILCDNLFIFSTSRRHRPSNRAPKINALMRVAAWATNMKTKKTKNKHKWNRVFNGIIACRGITHERARLCEKTRRCMKNIMIDREWPGKLNRSTRGSPPVRRSAAIVATLPPQDPLIGPVEMHCQPENGLPYF